MHRDCGRAMAALLDVATRKCTPRACRRIRTRTRICICMRMGICIRVCVCVCTCFCFCFCLCFCFCCCVAIRVGLVAFNATVSVRCREPAIEVAALGGIESTRACRRAPRRAPRGKNVTRRGPPHSPRQRCEPWSRLRLRLPLLPLLLPLRGRRPLPVAAAAQHGHVRLRQRVAARGRHGLQNIGGALLPPVHRVLRLAREDCPELAPARCERQVAHAHARRWCTTGCTAAGCTAWCTAWCSRGRRGGCTG